MPCAARWRCSRGWPEGNAETPPDKRIEFRIGTNLGDVIAEEHDIFGDGVNIAARLEALAEPGGTCVSHIVHDQVRDKLDFAFEEMGEQQVKNIARPVWAYKLRREVVASLPASKTAAQSQSCRLLPGVLEELAEMEAKLADAVHAWRLAGEPRTGQSQLFC